MEATSSRKEGSPFIQFLCALIKMKEYYKLLCGDKFYGLDKLFEF